MVSVIGLFWRGVDVDGPIQELKAGDIPQEGIHLETSDNAVLKLLGKKPYQVIKKYAVWGAFAGMVTYALFALLAGWCECNLFYFKQIIGIGALLGGILAGIFVGGFIGVLIGAGESERDTHLYVQGVRTGGKLLVIDVNEDQAERVMSILKEQNAHGVKALGGCSRNEA